MTKLEPPAAEPTYFIRRAQSMGLSYRIPVTPFPDECLEDLLIRAACENGFSPAMSYRMLGITEKNVARAAPGTNRFGISAENLSTLLGNPGGPRELVRLLHDKKPTRAAQRPFFDTWIDSNHFVRTRRVSPLALRRAPYLRAVWRLWPLAFDPQSKELLLEECPVCAGKLNASFMGDIWCCDRCSEIDEHGDIRIVDLRDFPQATVDPGLWENLDFATCFIDPTAQSQRRVARDRLHPDFENVSDGAVFDLVCVLARSMMHRTEMNKKIMQPPLLASAADIVSRWPASLEAAIANGSEYATKEHPFKALTHNPRLDERVRRRVKDLGRFPRILAKTKSKSGLSSAKLTSETLRARPEVRNFAKHFGFAIPTLVDLADDKFFPSEVLKPVFNIDFAGCAEQFVEKLSCRESDAPKPLGAVRLVNAVAALYARVGDPWPNIFRAILGGEIQYWMPMVSRRAVIEQIYVENVADLVSVLSRPEKTFDDGYRVELTTREARAWIRLWNRFDPALERGLIARPFSRASMAAFRRSFDCSSLIRVRLKDERSRTIRNIRLYLQSVGIVPILECSGGHVIWHRQEVERHFGDDLLPSVT